MAEKLETHVIEGNSIEAIIKLFRPEFELVDNQEPKLVENQEFGPTQYRL